MSSLNMSFSLLLLVTVFPFGLSVLLLQWLLKSKKLRKFALDQPNHRSLHVIPVPRSGGVAIMASTLLSWILSDLTGSLILVICVLVLMVFSLADDIRDLSARWRLLGHLLAAGIFIGFALASIPIWAIVLFGVAIVWMTNLFNFMDGSDGLAGGMALFGFGSYGIAAWHAGNMDLMATCFCISASATGFLLFNFHPAKIFMGDAGSIPLGFLSASLGLLGWQQEVWPLWFPILVFSPFICDATVTLLKRLMRGEKVWQAHRTHYYQRMVQMGWGHRKTAYAEYSLMMMTGGSAIMLIGQSTSIQLGSLILWILLYIALAMKIDRLSNKLMPET